MDLNRKIKRIESKLQNINRFWGKKYNKRY
jgi:hypothetical protein